MGLLKVLKNTFVYDRRTEGEGGRIRVLAFAGDTIPDTYEIDDESAVERVPSTSGEQSVIIGYKPEQLRTTEEGAALHAKLEAQREAGVQEAPSTEDLFGEQGAVEQHTSYNGKTVPQLREEIDSRGLEVPSDAKKADLVAALEEHDAENSAEDDDHDDDDEEDE